MTSESRRGKTQDTWAGAVENAEVAEIECAETMTTAELTEKSELLNLRQFMQEDPEHVDELQTTFPYEFRRESREVE